MVTCMSASWLQAPTQSFWWGRQRCLMSDYADTGRYLENVPAIVPLLEKEYRNAAQRLTATQEELTDLAPERLKEKVRQGHRTAS